MRGGATGRRAPPSQQPPPSIEQHRQHGNSRDSDASFASSRPSSIGLGRAADVYSDRSNQSTAIRTINAFLSSHSFPVSLRAHPVPSIKDVTETLKFLLSTVDFPCDSAKWDEDLVFFLKSINCPFKLTKSSLRAPNTPHNWPNVLAVAHWLVQVGRCCNRLLSSESAVVYDDNSLNSLAIQSYRHYINGEDDLVDELDSDFLGKLEAEKTSGAETIAGGEKLSGELEAKLEALRKGPSKKEALEKDKADLAKDVNKLRTIVAEYTDKIRGVEKLVEEKEKEAKAKEAERELISEENKELKKTVELQNFSARDVERMRRELQAVERDVAEAEVGRDGWEQKAWELNSQIGNRLHQIRTLAIDCNQALRRSKIDIQFVVNERGESPEDVMGVDYKSVVKPALSSSHDVTKGSMLEKAEELTTLQHQESEIASEMESKKSLIGSQQLKLNELKEKVKLAKKETQELGTKCDLEAKTMLETVQNEALNVEVVEKEAAEYLKASEVRLQEAEKQSEEEVQETAAKLFALIDSISKHKEYMDSKISEIKTGVANTANAVSAIYKASLKRHLGN